MQKYTPIWTALLLATLAGCSSLTGGDGQTQRYTLPTTETAASASAHFPIVLGVAQVEAPAWLDSARMLYRLEYKTQAPLAAYSRSRWAESPAAMLGQTLRDRLADSGLFNAVTTGAGAGAGADIVLQVTLSDFEQRFASRQRSFGVLRARATLAQPVKDKVLAQRDFNYRVAATSADAAGGVKALGKASRRFAAALRRWLRERLNACRGHCASFEH